jgi:MerR family redox-sensitive transcriptional activator SoxR
MDTLNIGEIARRSGLQTSAIRYYESIGLLPIPDRIGGWRYYETGVIDRLRLIRIARNMGFTLEEIRALLEDFPQDTPPSERWQTLAAEKLTQVDDIIMRATALKRLLEAGLRCECIRIEDCFGDGDDTCAVDDSLVVVDACAVEDACH